MEDISYSMIEDRKNDTSLDSTLPRRVYQWIDDSTVDKCYRCEKTFSIFLRKHHCRLCGKIFCSPCTQNRTEIPEELLSNDSRHGTWNDYLKSYVKDVELDKFRVCNDCYSLINRVNNVTKIIDVFNILDLSVNELHKASNVCKLWRYASNYCLSTFREIQYKLPDSEFKPLERKMLMNNLSYLKGHSVYLLQLLKVAESTKDVDKIMDTIKKCRVNKCMTLMCSRKCQNKFSAIDGVNLLAFCYSEHHQYDNKVKRKVIRAALDMINCSDREFKCYLPFLIYNIRHDSGQLVSFLFKRCINNFNLLNSLYWEVMLYPKDGVHKQKYGDLIEKLKDTFNDKKHERDFVKLLQGNSFVEVIKKIGKAICEDGKDYEEVKEMFTLSQDTIYPLAPRKKIKKIELEKAKVKDSFSKPIIIPLVTSKGKETKLMYKKDNLRKDQIIINLINLVDILFKKEEGIDLGIVTYNVLPLNKECGIIEIVDEADTVYFIQERMKCSILNYILEKNGSMTIKALRERFIKSTAAYSVITYLLGVGDRHLDNIMINRDGHLFHIDFGYILGADPVSNDPSIRITPEIVEALGGFSSVHYIEFTDLCTKIYNCLRRNIDIFMNMLYLLPELSDIKLSREEIREHVLRRFRPGENELDAQFHLVKKLEEHSYTDRIKDFCHYHKQEKTISSSIQRLGSALTGLWSSFYKDEQSNKE